MKYHVDKKDYKGFVTRPASWDLIVEKFNNLSLPFADEAVREEIIHVIDRLEDYPVSKLMELLEKVHSPQEKENKTQKEIVHH